METDLMEYMSFNGRLIKWNHETDEMYEMNNGERIALTAAEEATIRKMVNQHDNSSS